MKAQPLHPHTSAVTLLRGWAAQHIPHFVIHKTPISLDDLIRSWGLWPSIREWKMCQLWWNPSDLTKAILENIFWYPGGSPQRGADTVWEREPSLELQHNHNGSLHQREVLKRPNDNSDHTASCTPRTSPKKNKGFNLAARRNSSVLHHLLCYLCGALANKKAWWAFCLPTTLHTQRPGCPCCYHCSAEQIHHDLALQSNSSGCWTLSALAQQGSQASFLASGYAGQSQRFTLSNLTLHDQVGQ